MFDESLLNEYVDAGRAAVRHDPRRLSHRLRAAFDFILGGPGRPDSFVLRSRRLNPPGAVSIRVASTALDHFESSEDYRPPNLGALLESVDDIDPLVEPVVGLSESLRPYDYGSEFGAQWDASPGPISSA